MFRQIKAYIVFLFRSKNEHGVHSPFVFNLVTKCFYDKKKYSSYELLKQYRKSLLKDKRSIHVKDFGAGSKVFSSNERPVSAIAKNAGITSKRARLLNRLVRYLEVETALELGTSLGLGTTAISAGNNVRIITIEGCPETANVAEEKLKEFGLENVELKVGQFDSFLVKRRECSVVSDQCSEISLRNSKSQISNSQSSSTENSQPKTENRQLITHNSQLITKNYDLLYIDGNHQKEATLRYFEKLLSAVHNDSVMIFDDIHWSKDMEEAWEEIKQHPAVKVTIDTFFWGIVFFRKEQEKEHFVIRV